MSSLVVVGAGICGAATALALHDAGVDVLLLDRGEVSGATTGLGEGNVLRVDAPDGHAAWHDLADRFPEAVKLRAKGSLTVFRGDGAAELAARVGGEVVPDPHTIEPALVPGLPPAVLVTADLQVDPRATARAMAAEVPVRTGAEVVRAEPDGVTLAGGERIAADAVVIAAGPWSSELAGELDVCPRRGQLIALGPAPGLVCRKVIDASYPAAVASVIEEALSGAVYVGSSRDDVGFDPGTPHADALRNAAAAWMPALAELPIVRTWVGYRPYRPGGPFVGRLDSGVWAITGHEGAGVGQGPADGRRLAYALTAS
ncbi:MAG: FAD-dependent oxidoreductase [Solirubrobacteraceae bacterium]